MKKLSLTQRILQKNYLLLIIAVLISFGIWIYMSMNSTSDTTVTVNDVPIQIEISDSAKELGLQVFCEDDSKASVTVSGMRTMLGQISEADLLVTASAGSISTTGNHTLSVSATKANPSSNFQIVSCAPSQINVVVDYLKESTFDIQEDITYKVKDGYNGSVTLANNQVTISGPTTEVLKIKKVMAKADIHKNLLTLSSNTVDAHIEVVHEKTVPLEPVFMNKPSGLTLTEDMIKIEPSEIKIGGSQDALDNIKSVNLEAIDFSKISNQKIVLKDISIDVPDTCKNISDTSTATVTLDLRGMTSKKFDVENFSVEGLPSGYSCEVTSKTISVTVIGPKDEVEALKADDIVAVIDAKSISGKVGSVDMPVTFKFSTSKSCWAYGEYKANVTITES